MANVMAEFVSALCREEQLPCKHMVDDNNNTKEILMRNYPPGQRAMWPGIKKTITAGPAPPDEERTRQTKHA